MATVGLDTSAYQQSIEQTKASTKTMVASLTKEYTDLQKRVNETAQKYNEQAKATGETSKETRALLTQLQAERTHLAEVQQALNNASTYMKNFGDSTRNTESSLAGSIAKGQILGNVLTTLASKALDAAVGFVQTGIEYNAQIEKYTTGFTNMLGSAEAANEAIKAIQEDAARTPFDVASLTEANQLLISAGENAGYSRKLIMALGDAVSATGGGNVELSRMAANLQQIANVGKASAIDIKQFAYAGINIYQVLADYTGKSVQDVQNMTISYDLLSEALIAASEEGGRYYNAMDTQSQTMNGRVSTLKDNVSQLAGLMTGDLSNGIGMVISNLNDMTVAAQEAYKTDGWTGLIGEITGLSGVIDKAKSSLVGLKAVADSFRKGEISLFSGDWDAVYWNAFNADQTTKQGEKDWNESHAGMVWDENDGWVPAKPSGKSKSSITTSPTPTKTKTETPTQKHVAADTKKLADTIKETSQEILAGTGNIVGSIQRVTETADNTYNVYDGTTKQLKGTTKETVQTITDSWTEVVDGVEKTIRKVTKNVTDADGKITTTVNQTCDNVVLSVSEMQSRIDKNLSEAKTKWQNGIMGTLQSVLTDLKNGNWTSLATDFAKLIWGEVTQEQRNIISKWFSDALTAINNSYSGGGMSGLKDTLHKLLTDGITSDANDAKVAVQGLSQVINGLGESGGMGAKLAGIAGNFSGMAGVITKALSGIVGFIIANPVVAAILGLTALVGGAAFAKWRSSRDNDVTNNYKSPYGTTPVYDSLAEFSARADQLNRYSSVTASPFAGSQQDTTGKQQLSVLQRISNSLDEHLPAIGTGTLVIDANGVQALAGAMQPTLTNGIDGDLGIRAARKARGG
jgi:tape measure domain-containing protein|nr:MAG TPA: tail tape measure protein [Caudoviricetes sp.]DAQ32093.1 MAG TPA: tail tape measure protein [Caudoviricetes sp.]